MIRVNKSQLQTDVLMQPRVVTHQYFGNPDLEGRSFKEYVTCVGKVGLNFCNELTGAAQRIKRIGGQRFVLLDIGSDSKSRLAQSLSPDNLKKDPVDYWRWWCNVFEARDEEMKTAFEERRVLTSIHNQFDGVSFDYLGLTDAKVGNHGNLLFEKKFGSYRARNFAYTITASQTIGDFLNDVLGRNRGVIDMALGVFVFCYLTPRNFEQAIVESMESLTDEGKLIAIGIDPYYMRGRPGIGGGFVLPDEKRQRRMAFIRSNLGGPIFKSSLGRGLNYYSTVLKNSTLSS